MQERLAGKALLLTGASGFLGKAVLGQMLRELPDTRVTVLLRGDAERRLRDEVLTSDPCEGLDGSGVQAVSGDLGERRARGRRRHRHRHPLRRLGLVRAAARRGARAQRQGPRAAAERDAPGRQRPLRRPRLDRLRRRPAHRARARAPVRHRAVGARPGHRGRARRRPRLAARHRGRVAPPAAPAPLRQGGRARRRPGRRPGDRRPRRAAAQGLGAANSSPSAAASAPARSAGRTPTR